MDETLSTPRDHAQAYALTFPGAYSAAYLGGERGWSCTTTGCAWAI
jgi:hypothetical protein